MTIRDREVLEELRDDPELLAIADAVVETQRLRRVRPLPAVAAIALVAAALFILVLASPWDRGGTKAPVLDRALAAIEASGPVVHMTFQLEAARDRFSPVVTESYYDKEQKLVRVISRSDGKLLGDYTTRASEDEFVMFPGLLEGADYYRKALAAGNARLVGTGTWRGQPVRWVRLPRGGGPGILEIGIDKDTYQPVVFRGLGRDGKPSGLQVAVLGLEYVSPAEAAFDLDAPVLATGTVFGKDCRPARARVGAFIDRDDQGVGAEVASARTGPDGRFTLYADPAKEPFRSALAASGGWVNFDLTALTSDFSQGYGFWAFSSYVKDGAWWADSELEPQPPIRLTVGRTDSKTC